MTGQVTSNFSNANDSPLSDDEIEAILVAEIAAEEEAPRPLEMAQTPSTAWGRWLLAFMLGLMLIGSWVKP
jgi:hypothetical protein